MKTKLLGLAAIVLGSATSIASAQSVPPMSPSDLAALIKPGVTHGSGIVPNTAAANPNYTSGWNTAHCYVSYYYTPNNTDYYIFALISKVHIFTLPIAKATSTLQIY